MAKHLIQYGVWATLALGSGTALVVFVVRVAAAGKQPVTIEYRVENDSAPGGPLIDQRTYARKSDGSYMEAWFNPTPDGSKVQQRRIVDMSRRVDVAVDSYTQSLIVKQLSDQALTAMKQDGIPVRSCVGEKQADQMLGYDVYMLEQEAVRAGRKRQAWRAPALGCADLKRTSFILDDVGKWKIISDVTAVSIEVGEPSAHWFDIPSYAIKTYDDLAAEVKNRIKAAAEKNQ